MPLGAAACGPDHDGDSGIINVSREAAQGERDGRKESGDGEGGRREERPNVIV